MLGILRALTNTWAARIFFLVLAGAFALWGVANKNPFGSDQSAIAVVGGKTIEAPQVEQAYQAELRQVARQLGNPAEIPEQIRRQVAVQALDQVVMGEALRQRAVQMGLAVPDSAVRDAAFAVPQFRGPDGRFDRPTMRALLQSRGMSEAQFLDDLTRQIRDRQLLGAVTAGAAAPEVLARQTFAFQRETRTADAVTVSVATAPEPAAPADAELHRWYDNHPNSYQSPEYRHVKLVVLTPEVVGRDIVVSEDELRTAYEQHKAELLQPERRSLQVVTAQDEGAAQKISAQWSIGADWDSIQKAAQAAGATAVEMNAVTKTEVPGSELADAAFATHADTVSPPVKGALGWYVVRVAQVQPGGPQTFEQAHDGLRQRLVAEKAADQIDKESSQLDDEFAGGTTLNDKLFSNLYAATGTLDDKGVSPAGTPVPVAGSPALRQALIAAAFAAHPGDPLKLQRAPGEVPEYYAVQVDGIDKPSTRPFEQVADAVRADWTRDAKHRAQEAVATHIYTAAKGGASLADAARAQGLTARTLPPAGRTQPVDGVPAQLVAVLFGLHPNETTMVDTPDGFMVARLTKIDDPPPSSDPVGYPATKAQLAQAIGSDIQETYAFALRSSLRPTVNQQMLDRMTQSNSE